jgi:hypothetical protein
LGYDPEELIPGHIKITDIDGVGDSITYHRSEPSKHFFVQVGEHKVFGSEAEVIKYIGDCAKSPLVDSPSPTVNGELAIRLAQEVIPWDINHEPELSDLGEVGRAVEAEANCVYKDGRYQPLQITVVYPKASWWRRLWQRLVRSK